MKQPKKPFHVKKQSSPMMVRVDPKLKAELNKAREKAQLTWSEFLEAMLEKWSA